MLRWLRALRQWAYTVLGPRHAPRPCAHKWVIIKATGKIGRCAHCGLPWARRMR